MAWAGMYVRLNDPSREPPFLEVQNLQDPMCSNERITVRGELFVNELGRIFGSVGEHDKVAFTIVMAMRRK